MSYRSKLLSHKVPKQEQELHVLTNPFLNSRLQLINTDDYEAPLTANSLSPTSKWIIVRNNIHKIRSWSNMNTNNIEKQHRDCYLFVQMRRELRRAQEHIKQIEYRRDFVPVHYFDLPIDETHKQRYDVSHVQPSDALYYQGLGSEPIALQSLLFYFSKDHVVPYNSIFQSFLSNTCSILYRERQNLHRAAVFRKLALIISIIVFIILGLMLVLLIVSVLKTTSNLKQMYQYDPNGGIDWRETQTNLSSL